MEAHELLEYIEKHVGTSYLTELRVVNNKVVAFYQTISVKYLNSNGEQTPYLFPVTFSYEGGKIKTTMVFGSVTDNFRVPKVEATAYGLTLMAPHVGFHYYKLLIAVQNDLEGYEGFYLKPFMALISELGGLGFPFMRIADNNSINIKPSFYK